jgi:hypothetical protein
MEMALQAGPPKAAELVAANIVVEAHLNWELIEVASKALKGEEAKALKEAYEKEVKTAMGAARAKRVRREML